MKTVKPLTFKFSELNNYSQTVAAKDYLTGLWDNKKGYDYSLYDCLGFCMDTNDDVVYNEKGEIADE